MSLREIVQIDSTSMLQANRIDYIILQLLYKVFNQVVATQTNQENLIIYKENIDTHTILILYLC